MLHGCVGQGCNKVWGPRDDSDVCDLCGDNRYDRDGAPRECVVHFPLKDKIESLLKCGQFYNSVQWEGQRSHTNSDYITGKLLLDNMHHYCKYIYSHQHCCFHRRLRLQCMEGIHGAPR